MLDVVNDAVRSRAKASLSRTRGDCLRVLRDHGGIVEDPIEQTDQYFAHPCRDFAATDEALRIRTVGDKSFVTYKGPKLDKTTKTRREIELPLDPADHDGSQFASLLTALGFQPVAVVRKQRRPFAFPKGSRQSTAPLMTSIGLVVSSNSNCKPTMRLWKPPSETIAKLAAELNLGPSERRSYLEMLLEKIA